MPAPVTIKQLIPATPGWYAMIDNKSDMAILAWALIQDRDRINKPGQILNAAGSDGNVVVGLVATGKMVQSAEAMTGFSGYTYNPPA
jgi:hypothetical protein